MGRTISNRIIIMDGLIYVYDEGMHLLYFTDDRRVLDHTWYRSPQGYPRGNVNGTQIMCHRFLAGAPKGVDVDHINDCKMDLRRKNLQILTRSENIQKCRPQKRSRTGVKGITRLPDGRYRADITVGVQINLGSFETLEEAIRARKRAEENAGWLIAEKKGARVNESSLRSSGNTATARDAESNTVA